jgi:hypothetical protein
MKVRSILIPAILFSFVLLFNSCEDSTVGTLGGTTNVSGIVRGLMNYPLNNVVVTIQNKNYTTQSDGKFSFQGITLPYDIIVKDSVSKYQMLYKDVTGSELYLNLPLFKNQGLADYNLVVHYPASVQPQTGKLYFMDDTYDVAGIKDIEISNNIYINAPANLVLNGKVCLLSYIKGINQRIDDYRYFAIKPNVTIVSGSTAEVTFLQEDLRAVEEDTVSYLLTQPQGSNGLFSGFTLNFFNRKTSYYLSYQALEIFDNTNNVRVLMPKNLTVEFTPTLYSSTNSNFGFVNQNIILQKTGTNIPINLAGLPSVTAPEDNATNVDLNTAFNFQKQSISNVLVFTIRDTASNASYSLCTSANSIQLSQLSQLITFLPNTRYVYQIEQVGVSANNVGEYLTRGRNIPTYSGITQYRRFTTKP